MRDFMQQVTVIVHDTAPDRAMKRVLALLCDPAMVTIQAQQEETNPLMTCEAEQVGATPVIFLNVALKAGAGATGLFQIRPGTAARDALVALDAARPLRDEEWQQARREFFKVNDAIRRHLHDRSNDLSSGRASNGPDYFQKYLSQFRDYLRRFDFRDEAAIVEGMLATLASSAHLDGDVIEELRGGLNKIQTAIFGSELKQDQENFLPDEPPASYGTILVADDEGYPAECRAFFETRNYHIEVEVDEDKVRQSLEDNPSSVFLCDMTWRGDGLRGRDLMKLARKYESCFVIALSGSLLEKKDVPEAHALCDGVEAKTEKGALRVHQLIWQWSKIHKTV